MAVILNPMQQITGLSNSGTTDTTGAWNTSVDLTGAPFNIPSDASAVLIYIDPGGGGKWIGLRDPADITARSGWQSDAASIPFVVLAPLDSGAVDIYQESSVPDFFVAGYLEAGAASWLAAGSELTRDSINGNSTWDFSGDDATATGIIISQSQDRGDDEAALKIATVSSPTAYSEQIRWNSTNVRDYAQWVHPLNGSQEAFVQGQLVRTYHIVGFIHQDISFLYDDNGGPAETPTGDGVWNAGTFDYGAEEGIGCMIQLRADLVHFNAAADTSQPLSTGMTNGPFCTAVMHTVKSDGGWNYVLESGSPSYDIFWFMGAHAAVVGTRRYRVSSY